MENNWSGKRGRVLSSMLAVLAQDPDSGIINYGDADVTHRKKNNTVLEFLDFYTKSAENKSLKYLVFDNKFTTYENLSKLDDKGVKFITIRRRGTQILRTIDNLHASSWKTVRIEKSGNKKRKIKVHDHTIFLKGYEKTIRQIYITGHGKMKPAIIIANDFELPVEQVVRKYARRWNVEKTIGEQVDFFHLNRVSSSMVIKVDFDLTKSILAHNIHRLFAQDLGRYSHLSNISLYEKFTKNGADIEIGNQEITIHLQKKRQLPLILEIMDQFKEYSYKFLNDKKLVFNGASYS